MSPLPGVSCARARLAADATSVACGNPAPPQKSKTKKTKTTRGRAGREASGNIQSLVINRKVPTVAISTQQTRTNKKVTRDRGAAVLSRGYYRWERNSARDSLVQTSTFSSRAK